MSVQREREREGDLPFAHSLPKCQQQPILGHAKVANQQLLPGLHIGGSGPQMWAISSAFPSPLVRSWTRSGASKA